MKIHKEGYPTIILVLLLLCVLNYFLFHFSKVLFIPLLIFSLAFLIFILRFFRHPSRIIPNNIQPNEITSPCDGKVVVIEKVFEPEYFKEERIQVSIFMSPNNVHVNWVPIDGTVMYAKYHPGKHLVAWHPKSSTDNERTSIVIKSSQGIEVLTRQIAGAVARRIVYYLKEGNVVKKGDELGFIKFGSRVDVFLPLNANIEVQMNDIVKGNISKIATIG